VFKININIGILTFGFNQWGGGIDFIKHMLNFLLEAKKNGADVSITLFLPKNTLLNTFKNYVYPIRGVVFQILQGKKIRWTRRPGFSRTYLENTFSDFNSNLKIVFCGPSFKSQLNAAKKSGIDLVFPCIDVPPVIFSIPWVGYIPDFQHCHLPQYFSKKEIIRRNKKFSEMLNQANHLVVYSKSVAQDAEVFFARYKAKIHTLPFCPCPQKEWVLNEIDVRSKYGVQSPYFLISNQFWVHKDHVTAFRAFAKYCKKGGKATLVCTGELSDSRFPFYFNEILILLNSLGIADKVKILGHIPKLDQIALLKKSLAVIQTTLFEGGPGGGSVYDSISLGIPAIVSNIPINLEIDCGDVVYFKVGNDTDLGDAMVTLDTKIYQRQSNNVLWSMGSKRKARGAESLMTVIREALKN
jgi:glycosyltransferase involved in cell wall biosynthesis